MILSSHKKQRILTSRFLLVIIVIAAAFLAAFLGQVFITELSFSPSLLPENGIIVRTQTNDPATMRKHAQAIVNRDGAGHVQLYATQDIASAHKEGWVVSNDGWIMTFQEGPDAFHFVRLNSGTFYPIKSSVLDQATGLRFVKIDQTRLQPLTIAQRFEEEAFDPLISVSADGLASSATVVGWKLQSMANGRFSSEQVNRFPVITVANTVDAAYYNTNEELVCLLLPREAASLGNCLVAEQIRLAMDQVLRSGSISRAALGVTYQELNGAVVVSATGAAAKAGVRIGDVVTAVDGTPLGERLTLSEAVLRAKSGDKIELTISRRDQPLSISVTLE